LPRVAATALPAARDPDRGRSVGAGLRTRRAAISGFSPSTISCSP
jgi:hypothetical protein